MGLRELAASQLKCVQEANAAEAAARQTAHTKEALRLCQGWFNGALKVEPDEMECTSRYDGYHRTDGITYGCRVRCDDIWFDWISNVQAWKEQYQKLDPIPAVRVIENRQMFRGRDDSPMRWEPVVTTYSYTGYLWATNLPMLGLHLQAVDKVHAKR